MSKNKMPGMEHRARKRFAQNFLEDDGIIRRIIKSIHPQADDNIVEIGPGKGAITEHLLASCPTLKVVELDRSQPEFTSSFADYYTRRVSDTRIETGRKKYQALQPLLQRLTREYGIPGHYLVAFWGLETNYGGYKGTMSTVRSLATMAYSGRR